MADDPSQFFDFNDRYEDPAEDPLFNIDGDNPNRVDIFIRKEFLKVGHVPENVQIVGRDKEIKDIVAELRPTVQNDLPNNVMIYGGTGTGGSLAVRHVAERVRRAAESNGASVGTVYVDYAQHNTQTCVAQTVTQELNKTEKTDLGVPRAGTGSGGYYDYLWEILNFAYDAVVIILNEVGRLNDDDTLMQLPRTREPGRADCHPGVIAVSSKIEYRDQSNERVKSSFREEEFVFQPYDANQLRGIMKHRRDASYDDVLSDGVILLTVALVAQEHGDVRKAIKTLRHAGELAERENADRAVAEHVRDAQEWVEVGRFEELLRGSTTQAKLIFYSLVLSIEESSNEDELSTSHTYKRYQNTAETVDAKVLSEHRVYELLKE